MLSAEDIERLSGFVRLEPAGAVDVCRIIHRKWQNAPLELGPPEAIALTGIPGT